MPNKSSIYRFWLRVDYHFDKLLRIGPKREFKHVLNTVKKKSRQMIWRKAWSAGLKGDLLAHTLRDPRAANYLASRDYVPQLYPGTITLFQCVEKPPWPYHDPEMGWGNLATEGIEIHELPGSHTGMYKEPEVLALVDKSSACLQKARARVSNNETSRRR